MLRSSGATNGVALIEAGPDDALKSTIVARTIGTEGGRVQSIICFGSRASEKATGPDSDIDILVLVDPPAAWGPRENIAARKRLEAAISALPVRLDLWVRTIDQFEEAKDVIGGYEHAAAATGTALWSRARRRQPIVCRSRDDVRYRNVCDWLELSRRLLGRSVQLSSISFINRGRWLSSEHYAWRACMAAMGALFVWRQEDIPSKYDDVNSWLRRMADSEPTAAESVADAFKSLPSGPHLAHQVIRAVVGHLRIDKQLHDRMCELEVYLARPLEGLAAVPSLKE